VYCPKCGTQTESDNYCRSCGANLTRVAKVLTDPQLSRGRAGVRGGTTLGLFNATVVTNEGRDLDGYNAVAVFGGVKLVFTSMPLPPGETRINVAAVFGGAEVIVPDDVGIRITGVTIFGGVKVRGKDIRGGIFSLSEYISPGYHQATRRLHIDATTVFGGMEVK
jgi:predicted membrane protein